MDLTADVARERGLAIDEAGFAAAMEAQRDRARAASKFGVDLRDAVKLEGRVDFCGYEHTAATGTVVALIRDGAQVQRLEAGESGQVVLDQTPFYAESGGQMGDTGLLLAGAAEFTVNDTVKVGKQHAHVGRLAGGSLEVGARIEAAVNVERRDATRRNHSATHLLHAALREVLGAHVQQKGSLVSADRLRFDFSHFQGVSPAELARIEQWVNLEVRTNGAAETRVMAYEDALNAGAIGLFGEKYESEVRVLSIGERSTELCGGTHVSRTGDIGLFKLLAESGVASGVRRIEAVTGQGALDAVAADEQRLKAVAQLVRGTREDVAEKVEALLERSRRLEKEVEQLKSKLASGQGGDLSAQAVEVAGIKLLAARIDGADAKSLRGVVDGLKAKLGSSVVVLAAVEDGKVALVASVSADLVGRVKAGELVGHVAAQVGGKGGGRPDFAQAGGTDPDKLAGALAGVQPWVAAKLGA
jgi:alanyl-tRNA synthetase